MPTISVIVPVYKVEKYIHRCVNSILNQTYQDFELILVDDGSPDNSGAICDEYAAKDSRIRVIHKLNGGVSSARNVGLDHAKGQFVMFCDSDDYVEPEWCEHLFTQISQYPESWCFCGCHCVDATGKYTEENCVFHPTPVYEVLPISEYEQLYQTNYAACLWERIFNMDIIRKHHIRFDEKLSVSEDVLFTLEYGQHCNSISVVNLPLYNHRVYLNNEVEHLDGNLPKEMFYINRRVYAARMSLVTAEHRLWHETNFFYRFIDDMKRIAADDDLSEREKLQKTKVILSSPEFKSTLRNADTHMEHWKFLTVLKLGLSRVVLRLFKK